MKASNTVLFRALLILLCCSYSFLAKSQPKAAFTSNTTSGCPPLIVFFQDQSSGNPTTWKWDLGNGAPSIQQNPITTYFDPGVYTVRLIVTNSSGSDSVVKINYITVAEEPEAGFSVSTTQGCFPLDVSFFDNSTTGTDKITQWQWDFGDGNIDNTGQPTHTYTSEGLFDITLTATNSSGCKSTITKSDYIKIEDGAVAAFEITSLDICKSPATVTFKNQTTSTGPVTYSWDFGDGGTATNANPVHNYSKPGTYNVLLTVTAEAGCTDTASASVVIAFPKSSFSNIADTICTNTAVTFTNTSTPAPVSSTWTFGDGTGSTVSSPVKTYTNTGDFQIMLINRFSATCSDTATSNVTVVTGPSASFFTNDTSNCTAPYTSNFKNTSTGTGNTYLWTFGDGKTSKEENPAHTFTSAGFFTVTLKVTNSNGCASVFTIPNCVIIQPVRIVDIKDLPISGCVPVSIQPKADININVKIKSYLWDFGDGTTSTKQFPTHTYTTDGFFTVSLTIETADGCTDKYSVPGAVSAGHKPEANFIADPPVICANETVTLINTSTNGPIHFLQWGNDEITSNPQDSIHQFPPPDTGYIEVTLIAYNYGCPDTVTIDSVVYVKPPISRIDLVTNCINRLSVQFGDSSIGAITRLWDFGDGRTDTTKNPAHLYSSAGTYKIELITKNGACIDTAQKNVRLIDETGKIKVKDSVFCKGNLGSFSIGLVNSANIRSTFWDFGDGQTSTTPGTTITHIYTESGRYKITCVMTDLNGCTYNLETLDSISVFGPTARFSTNTPGVCINTPVDFIDLSQTDGTHAIKNWTWDYGDKVINNYKAPPFIHTYTAGGLYSVKLLVQDSFGCIDSIRKVNYIDVSDPRAAYSTKDTLVCPGNSVSFQNTSNGRALKYNWDFGNGDISTETNPVYTYPVSGYYTPILSLKDIYNCVDTFNLITIRVTKPKSNFNMSDSFTTCPPLTVSFTNKGKDYVSYKWDFGDGSTSTLLSPSHVYTYPGDYPVVLSLTGNGSCKDSLVKHVIIQGPSGTIKYDSAICYPASINISANTKNTVIYTWDFTDGTTIITSTPNASHNYDPGFYVPRVILSDSLGCQVPIRGKDTLKIFAVEANGIASSYQFCDTGFVQFNNLSTSNDSLTNFTWIFGDGSPNGSGQSATHSYASSGVYTAGLIAVSKNGCTDTSYLNTSISILKSPKVRISGDSIACTPATINLKGINKTGDSTALVWNWNFGNGITQFGPADVSTLYEVPGFYTVSVTAQNINGCADSASRKIEIKPSPVIDAGTDASICLNSTYNLTVSGANKYSWISGEGINCNTCSSQQVSPKNSGSYIVKGTDINGCQDYDTVSVTVINPVSLNFSGTDTVCVGQTAQLTAAGATTYQWLPATFLDNATSGSPVFTASKDTLINYKVVGFSGQNCFSDTGVVSVKVYPVPQMKVLQDQMTLIVGNSVQLQTSNSPDITGWKWEPAEGLSDPNAASPTATPKKTVTYSCLAVNGGGCISRDEVVINVLCGNSNIYIPNTFSPNKDGVNDVFYPRGKGLFQVKSFRIFNRWGQLVFARFNVTPNNEADGWNGQINTTSVSSDVYVYMMEIVCENNTVIPVKGNVTLLR